MRFFNRYKNRRSIKEEAPIDESTDIWPGLPHFRVTPPMVVPPPGPHLTDPGIPNLDDGSTLGYMFDSVLKHFNPDHIRTKFRKQWEDNPSDIIAYLYWKREDEEADPEPKGTPIVEIRLTRLPSETHDAYGKYLTLLMDLQPDSDGPRFSNIERAKRIGQHTGLDRALERIPRKIIDDALSVECTREWGDGWEVLEPYLDNHDLEDSYRQMMDWIAGGGVAVGQIIRNSRKVMPAYDRLTQLLDRLQTVKDSGELDAARREERRRLAGEYGISAIPYDPANIWFDEP